MAARVTPDEVKEIIDTNLTIDAFITAANLTVNNNILNQGLSDETLKEIERWLAAHFVAIKDKKPVSKAMGDASVDYGTVKGLGLDQTEYGQQVKILDTTGILSNLGKNKASLSFIKGGD